MCELGHQRDSCSSHAYNYRQTKFAYITRTATCSSIYAPRKNTLRPSSMAEQRFYTFNVLFLRLLLLTRALSARNHFNEKTQEAFLVLDLTCSVDSGLRKSAKMEWEQGNQMLCLIIWHSTAKIANMCDVLVHGHGCRLFWSSRADMYMMHLYCFSTFRSSTTTRPPSAR